MPDQLPGMNIFSVLAQVPADFLNLGVRHVGEVNTILSMSVQRLGAELATPPQLPQGLPQLPLLSAGMPQLPGLPQLPGVSAAPSPAGASVSGMGFGSEFAVAPRMII